MKVDQKAVSVVSLQYLQYNDPTIKLYGIWVWFKGKTMWQTAEGVSVLTTDPSQNEENQAGSGSKTDLLSTLQLFHFTTVGHLHQHCRQNGTDTI